MNEYREKLIDRMTKIYGLESPIVIDFCRLCESSWMSDKALTTTVECHEAYPITEDWKILGFLFQEEIVS